MKFSLPLEPGVISTLRLFTGVRLFFSLLGSIVALLHFGLQNLMVSLFILVGFADVLLLFLYLSIPKLQRWLKGAYLPVAIIWAAVVPILFQHLSFRLAGYDMSTMRVQLALWQLILVLFIPLVVTAWQYSLREVVLFSVLTALINASLLGALLPMLSVADIPPVFGAISIQTVAYLLVGYMIVNLMKVQRAQRQKLSNANQELAQYAATLEQLTISRERNRMARELHDVLAHTLSGVAVELEGVRALLPVNPDQASGLLNNSLVEIREGLSETRRALKELRARPLEDLGLALAVRSLAQSIGGRAGLQMTLNIAGDFSETPGDVQQCVYRVTQEALANITDHAQAQTLSLTLNQDRAKLRLCIEDDGLGFDPAVPLEEYQYGLKGMRERVEMIGGDLVVDSRPGRGTRIVFSYDGVNR